MSEAETVTTRKTGLKFAQRTIENSIRADLAVGRRMATTGDMQSVERAMRRCLREMATLFEPLERARDRPSRFVWQELRLDRKAVLSAQRLCQEACDHLPNLGLARTKIDQAIAFWNERKKLDADWPKPEGE